MQTNKFSTKIDASDYRIAIVRARFNEEVTGSMLEGCLEVLKESGVKDKAIHSVEVPGAFEIPLMAQYLAEENYDAIITLGCVLRGQTPHDIYISTSVTNALQDIALDTNKPIILGVITPITQEQAEARSKGKHNKGVEAAHSALEMISILKKHSE